MGEISYGHCPQCGGIVVSRERRLNGNDTCIVGHVFPSANILHSLDQYEEARKKKEWAAKAESLLRISQPFVLTRIREEIEDLLRKYKP